MRARLPSPPFSQALVTVVDDSHPGGTLLSQSEALLITVTSKEKPILPRNQSDNGPPVMLHFETLRQATHLGVHQLISECCGHGFHVSVVYPLVLHDTLSDVQYAGHFRSSHMSLLQLYENKQFVCPICYDCPIWLPIWKYAYVYNVVVMFKSIWSLNHLKGIFLHKGGWS